MFNKNASSIEPQHKIGYFVNKNIQDDRPTQTITRMKTIQKSDQIAMTSFLGTNLSPAQQGKHNTAGLQYPRGVTQSRYMKRNADNYRTGIVEHPWFIDPKYYYSFLGPYNEPSENDTIIYDKATGNRVGLRRHGDYIPAPRVVDTSYSTWDTGFFRYIYGNFFQRNAKKETDNINYKTS
jgi:hypothetical protein